MVMLALGEAEIEFVIVWQVSRAILSRTMHTFFSRRRFCIEKLLYALVYKTQLTMLEH
jgi:hypothetical protein